MDNLIQKIDAYNAAVAARENAPSSISTMERVRLADEAQEAKRELARALGGEAVVLHGVLYSTTRSYPQMLSIVDLVTVKLLQRQGGQCDSKIESPTPSGTIPSYTESEEIPTSPGYSC